MNGYPTYVGDQSHVVMVSYDTLGTVKKDISSSTTQAWLGANASDLYQAVADDGTVYEFAEYAVTTDDRQLVWVIDGNDLKLYVNSWLSSTKDVTGKTFTLDRYGADADSTTGDTEVKNGYPKSLSQEDVKYWSYLRDANGNILVDSEGNPLLPSEPPSAPVAIDSYLPSNGNYALASKDSNLDMTRDQTYSFRVYAPPSGDTTNGSLKRQFVLNVIPNIRTTRVDFSYNSTLGLRMRTFYYPTVGSTSGVQDVSSDYYLPRESWYHILIEMDVEGDGEARIFVNGVQDPNTITLDQVKGVGNSDIYPLGLGTGGADWQTSNSESPMNAVEIWDRLLTSEEKTEVYNGAPDKIKCPASYSAGLQSGLVFSASLEDSALEEHTGNSTITATGTPSYVSEGMKKECSE